MFAMALAEITTSQPYRCPNQNSMNNLFCLAHRNVTDPGEWINILTGKRLERTPWFIFTPWQRKWSEQTAARISLKNKPTSIDDRSQTDRVTILTNPITSP